MTKFSVNRRRVVSIAAALSMMLAASPAVAQTAKRSAISLPTSTAESTTARADGRSADAAPAAGAGGATVASSGSVASNGNSNGSANGSSSASSSDTDAAASGGSLDAPVAAQSSATCNGVAATIVGTPGNDVLEGTNDDDVIQGLGGNDVINGKGGNDLICGDDGNDVIGGDDGNDTIFGEAGDDILNGDDGNDVMDGGIGVDNVQGGRGNDTMNGGPGDDIMGGGDDDDTMFGDAGADNMNGGKGNDYMDGGDGADLMSGSNGNDTLLGRGGPDVLNGGPQFDTCDVGPGGSSATKCENQRPQAVDQSQNAVEDGGPVGPFAFATTDPDGDPTTYNILSSPSEGSVTNNGNGTFTFDPGADFQDLSVGDTRDVSFDYRATDVHGATSDVATVTVTVTGVNDAPDAVDDTDSTDEDSAVNVDVLGNDTDVDANDVLSVDSVDTTGTVGAVSNNVGDVTYDPNGQFESLAEGVQTTDSFGYTVTDNRGEPNSFDSATVTITVTGVNDSPVAANVAISADEDGVAVDGSFSATDVDVGDILTFTVLTAPSEGSVINNGDGTFSFNPGTDFQDLAAGATRDVSFDYKATDDSGTASADSNIATVTVTVTGVDDPAVANDDDGYTTNEDSPVLITGVLANDDDVDDGEMVSVSGPANGPGPMGGFQSAGLATVVNNFDGTFSYDPTTAFQSLADGESAPDSFEYEVTSSNPASGSDSATVSITVAGVNDAPVANDGAAGGTGTFSITLTADDPDATDDLTFNVDAASAEGGMIANLVVDPGTRSATVDYTAPASPPTTTDSFTFTVTDDSFDPVTSAPGTITIVLGNEVVPPPAPVVGVTAEDQTETAGTGPVDVAVGTPVEIVISATAPFGTPAVDDDIGDITFSIDTAPGLGSLGALNDIVPNDTNDPIRSAVVTYTPPASPGITSFVFKACGTIVEGLSTGTELCDTATVEIDIDVAAAATPPPVTPRATALNPETSTTIDLGLNDGSPSGSTVCDPEEGRTCTGSRPAAAGSDQARHAPGTGPGVYFLLDTTGSMSSSIEQAKDDIQAVIADVKAAFPDADFGLGDFKDFPSDPYAFFPRVSLGPDDGVGGNTTDVSDVVETLFASGGGDLPEAQFFALDQLLDTSNPADFDPDEVNVIVMLGDAPAHDRICSAISLLNYDVTEQSVIDKLLEPEWATAGTTSGVKLVAMSTSLASGGLNADPVATSSDYDSACGASAKQGEPGQATRLAAATGGTFLQPGSDADALAQAIKDAIESHLTYQVLLPLDFQGTLTDSKGNVIPLNVLTTVPTTMLNYSSTGVSAGTQTQFSYTVKTSTGLSATENFYISVVASFVLPDGCELVGRPPGCVPNP